MYDILANAFKDIYDQVIKTYFIGINVDEPSQESYELSELLDMAYCIAHDFEVCHPEWTTYFRSPYYVSNK